MKSVLLNCPKCQSNDTTKNGTAPSKAGRSQRFRCNNCKHIWNDDTFLPNRQNASRASNRHNPPHVTSLLSREEPLRSGTGSDSWQENHLQTQSPAISTLHHRLLELDIPLDWSPLGLLDFAREAQHKLIQATLSFGQPGLAELEWNALSPALKAYVKARQHLDFALLLQLSTVFGASNTFGSPFSSSLPISKDRPYAGQQLLERHLLDQTSSSASNSSIKPKSAKQAKKPVKTQLKPKQIKKRSRQVQVIVSPRAQSDSSLESKSSDSSPNSSAVSKIEEPDRTQWLETLSLFQQERQKWSQEREQLLQNMRELEEIQSRNTLRLTSVTHDFERLKKSVQSQPIPKTNSQSNSKAILESTSKVSQHLTTSQPHETKGKPPTSSNFRTMPPKYSAQEEANLERLASSLMANLVRLEGHSVRPQDLEHITGERGPWKAVIDHLLTLGKIDRQGEFLAISLIERLRRGLKAPSAKPIIKTN